jgi:hypothetical protein
MLQLMGRTLFGLAHFGMGIFKLGSLVSRQKFSVFGVSQSEHPRAQELSSIKVSTSHDLSACFSVRMPIGSPLSLPT